MSSGSLRKRQVESNYSAVLLFRWYDFMQTSALAAAINAAGPLSYPFAEPPAAGRVCEVAPGLYWLRMPLPFALNHINLWLLRDGNGWTAVDCGIGLDETRAHWETILRDVV